LKRKKKEKHQFINRQARREYMINACQLRYKEGLNHFPFVLGKELLQ
jgi:hypothetical protein